MVLGKESGFENKQTIEFDIPRTVDYRANVQEIAKYMLLLMGNEKLRTALGSAAREHVVEHFDYRVVAKKFIQIVQNKLGID